MEERQDLISRQVAIDAMGKAKWAKERLMELPSAQPEIIRCKDCKHRHVENMVWTCPFGLPGGENFFCGYGTEPYKGGNDMDDLISRKSAIEAINGMIDRFERILADIRESKGDDSVCGMCEYDGAYMGQSGDWCNECPGFDKDDCFKLSDKCRKRWIGDIVLPSAAPTIAQTNESSAHTTAPPTDGWVPCIARLPKPYRGGDSE